MYARPDIPRFKLLDEARPVDLQAVKVEAEHVQVPGVIHASALHRRLQRLNLRERRLILRHNLPPPRLHCLKPLKLHQPDSRLNVRHVVLEARRNNLVVPRAFRAVALPGIAVHAVQGEHPRPLDALRRAGQHAAFAGGEVFRGVEAKCREVANRAHLLPPVGGGQGMSGILDHVQPVRARQIKEGLHVCRVTGVVNGQDGLRARGDGLGHAGGVQRQRVRLDICQHRCCPHVLDHVDGGA